MRITLGPTVGTERSRFRSRTKPWTRFGRGGTIRGGLLGVPRESPLDRPFTQFVQPDDQDGYCRPRRAVGAAGRAPLGQKTRNARVSPGNREDPGVGRNVTRIRRSIRRVMAAAGLEPATPTM